ncbi:aromatic-L-amino-acid decarboxylase [Elysia marginata]|uniref:Aromatic-L-amino-acid decarboxylase n=1 Tax=Elysia marginata TaxID=1093978 RepID=A0AAV4GGY6_9GAST|nr:aromatic-L-amino-acid decarboxylase [Elysia marginata]
MDAEEFRSRGREMVDYITEYLEGITTRPPYPTVSPGYLRELIPDHAPLTGESWTAVKADIERVVMPGVTHWHNPHFHAYFPTANSYPAILGDMLSDAIACIGFTWASSPACTELEVSMMDWIAKMLQLPREFLFSEEGTGGGVIQGTASEATLVALLSARTAAMHKMREDKPDMTQGQILDKLVAYTSEEAHSSVQRAALIGMVQMRQLPTDSKGALRGVTLETAIREDREKGLHPFFHSMSFNFNPHKWMRVNFDCSAMWVKDRYAVTEAFEVNPLYLKHDHQGQAIPDYRHWHIPLGRRFRSLKVWFVLRMFGVSGLQQQIRKDVSLAQQFERLVRTDARFEIFGEVVLGLVCFRLKGDNETNERLNKMINDDRRIHLTPSQVKDTYFLRFAVCASSTQGADVTYAWSVVKQMADKLAKSSAK